DLADRILSRRGAKPVLALQRATHKGGEVSRAQLEMAATGSAAIDLVDRAVRCECIEPIAVITRKVEEPGKIFVETLLAAHVDELVGFEHAHERMTTEVLA